MILRCRPFYLPHEFTVVIIMAVYIPPSANAKIALNILLHKQTTDCAPWWDFHYGWNWTVLRKFKQYVTCPTRGRNTLDHVYGNIRKGYKVSMLPHLGQFDHLSLFLTPAYRPLTKTTKPTVRYTKIWPEDAAMQLQDCFERTQWDLFEYHDVAEYASIVMLYIQHCIDSITEFRRTRCHQNK